LDIEQQNIWIQLLRQIDRLGSVCRVANNFEARLCLEKSSQTLSEQSLVIGNQQSDAFASLRSGHGSPQPVKYRIEAGFAEQPAARITGYVNADTRCLGQDRQSHRDLEDNCRTRNSFVARLLFTSSAHAIETGPCGRAGRTMIPRLARLPAPAG